MTLQNLVVVTGMSGSGKGTVLKVFEDLGYFCIDNLPVLLIPKFLEVINASESASANAALVIDIRAGERLQDLERKIADFKKFASKIIVLYLEARDEVLVRRFSETRRPHPLKSGSSLIAAIKEERQSLRKLREMADIKLDTSDCSVHQIRASVLDHFKGLRPSSTINVHLLSFGFKHGIPLEADLVFDARFLPNPFFVPKLKAHSGREKKVKDYLRSFPETSEYVNRIGDLLLYLLPHYEKEGKTYLTVAVGCTGGRHRSIYVIEELAQILKNKKRSIVVRHRDEKI